MMPGRGATGLTLAAACLVTGCSKEVSSQSEPLRVAAAADLSFAFEEIGVGFQKATGRRVVFSFGSTGLLEKQIAEGAPYDVFAAADVSFADDAVKVGACLADTKLLYATGRIVLYAAKGAFTPRSILDLTDARVTRIAIANPEHAPYGRAAKEAIVRAGAWPSVQAKVVYGDNVHQALQFALSGNADVAIVALSLAVATPGEWTPISADLHDRIDQALVVCARGKAGPAAGGLFAAYVGSPAGRAVMHKYGFLLPGESVSEAKRESK
jgi:molybdate transport system substrate-binding protein